MTIKRATTTIFLVVSTLMLLCGALLLPWWSGELERGSYSIDLRGMTMCLDSICAHKPLSVADPSAAFWAKLGIGTFAASLVASLLMVACLWKSVSGFGRSTLYWIAGAMMMFTGVLGLLFVWIRPEFGEWAPSYGMASTLAGAFLGAIAVSVAARIAVTEPER